MRRAASAELPPADAATVSDAPLAVGGAACGAHPEDQSSAAASNADVKTHSPGDRKELAERAKHAAALRGGIGFFSMMELDRTYPSVREVYRDAAARISREPVSPPNAKRLPGSAAMSKDSYSSAGAASARFAGGIVSVACVACRQDPPTAARNPLVRPPCNDFSARLAKADAGRLSALPVRRATGAGAGRRVLSVAGRPALAKIPTATR